MPAPANLIHETSTTGGTGNLTLVNVNGKVNFSDATYGFGTGGTDVFDYFISDRDSSNWERGTGHMSDATTLVRDTVIESSNSDAAVNFTASNTLDITNDIPAASQVTTDTAQTISGVKTFSAAPVLAADTVDAITEIAAALKTGADGTLVTGTAGTANNLAMWDANGDAVDSTVSVADVQQTDEEIQDIVGGMVTTNTETGIAVTYQDADGTLDFVVSDLTVAGDTGSTGMTPGDTLTIAGGTEVTTAMSGDTLTINSDFTPSSTDTFTNKTFDANGTGNSLSNVDLTADITGTLPVANGGTGATTLTDGGILLGSGTGAITALAALADGSIVVGDGTTDPVPLAAFSSSTGNLLAGKGGTIGQQTIWIPACAMEPRVTTAPATSNVVEIATSLLALRTMDFATDADDHAGFAIQMPKGWNESTLIAQFVWSNASGTGGVTWGIRAGAYADSDALTTALGTAVLVDDTMLTAGDAHISPESSAITVAGSPAAEEWVYFEVYRDVSDANDTLGVDARLHGVKIHYTIDAGTDD